MLLTILRSTVSSDIDIIHASEIPDIHIGLKFTKWKNVSVGNTHSVIVIIFFYMN